MAMNQEGLEPVQKVNLCHDGLKLFRISKSRVGEKKDVVGLVVKFYTDTHIRSNTGKQSRY